MESHDTLSSKTMTSKITGLSSSVEKRGRVGTETHNASLGERGDAEPVGWIQTMHQRSGRRWSG